MDIFGVMKRVPELEICLSDYEGALNIIIKSFEKGGKLLLCGNGGSGADCAHIAGELLKGFLKKRPLPAKYSGLHGADKLQMGLPAIDLTAHCALIGAVANDLGAQYVYAQQVMAYGRPGDVIIGISTSGNAENVLNALNTAAYQGMATIGFTGESGGKMAQICDICLRAPAKDTYLVQEYHIALYHALCAQIESYFFSE